MNKFPVKVGGPGQSEQRRCEGGREEETGKTGQP